MTPKYNILITYDGDGDFKFRIRKIGDVTITRTQPIYIYNATMDVINDMRQLKRMLVNTTIGAKPTGAYKIYNYDEYLAVTSGSVRPEVKRVTEVTNEDISNILKGGSAGPIEEEPVKTEEQKEEKKTPAKTTKKRTTKKTSKK